MTDIPKCSIKAKYVIEVNCNECGNLATFPDTDDGAATADVVANNHNLEHEAEASPIRNILKRFEDLKVLENPAKTKSAIDLHGIVEVAMDDPDLMSIPEVRDQLEEINDWVLTEVFKISPEAVAEARTRK
jgi:hypothetical protein